MNVLNIVIPPLLGILTYIIKDKYENRKTQNVIIYALVQNLYRLVKEGIAEEEEVKILLQLIKCYKVEDDYILKIKNEAMKYKKER